jgi:transposase-like protein
MGKGIKEEARAQELEPVSLSELIHQHVRAAIETAVHEELRAALGTSPYERRDVRRRYRNGVRERTLTGPTGPVALTLPRATLFSGAGDVKEWTSSIVPRYQRRIPDVNEAVIATYLAGGNTRRIRGALQPLVKAAPLSKSAVSGVIATLKGGLEAWRTRSLTDLDVIDVYLDGFALRVRSGGKVVSVPVLGVVGGPCRRGQTAPRPGAMRRRVVRGVEGVPRRSRRARIAGAGAGDHRRQCRAAARRRARLAQGGGPTVLRAQAAQS